MAKQGEARPWMNKPRLHTATSTHGRTKVDGERTARCGTAMTCTCARTKHLMTTQLHRHRHRHRRGRQSMRRVRTGTQAANRGRWLLHMCAPRPGECIQQTQTPIHRCRQVDTQTVKGEMSDHQVLCHFYTASMVGCWSG